MDFEPDASKLRLLDTITLKPHEFLRANIPPYTILSLHWGDSEVAFKVEVARRLGRMDGNML